QPLHDGVQVVGGAEVGQEAVEGRDGDVRVVGTGAGQHVDALLGAEEPALGLVHPDRDHDLVEEGGGPGDDVDVAVRHRVERPGTRCSPHAVSSAQVA